MLRLDRLIKVLYLSVDLACTYPEILAVGLCGSWARGTQRPDSDFDLSLVTEEPDRFRSKEWIGRIDFKSFGEELESYRDADYGPTWSRHVRLSRGTEIEFGFAPQSWADTSPLDPGTRRVVENGYRIIYDPELILNRLVEKVNPIS